jgi:hypothetical protein
LDKDKEAMKQTRTLTYDKIYDRDEQLCRFMADGIDGPEEISIDGIATAIAEYLERMKKNHSNAKISVSFREEV